MSIAIHYPGMLTTVQDLGRFHYAHLGISPAGAADALSLRIANRLAGNAENTPALEMTLVGATMEFRSACRIALAGADVAAESGVPMLLAVDVPGGFVLTCGALQGGARTYLSVGGGVEVDMVLGSASTHLAAGIGGLRGRALRQGDVLPTSESTVQSPRVRQELLTELTRRGGAIRVTEGTQENWFGDEALRRFYSSEYTVTEQSNRLGLRLAGPAVPQSGVREMLTEGVSLGAVQIPSGGEPILLLVDQQTTGGYPKIANVIAADLHRVGQLRPRDVVCFEKVSLDEAVAELRRQEQLLEEAIPA